MSRVSEIVDNSPGVPKMLSVGQGAGLAEPNPIEQAIKDQERMVALRMRSNTMGQLDAVTEADRLKAESEAAKAELERFKSQAELEGLKAEMAKLQRAETDEGQTGGVMGVLLSLLRDREVAASDEARELRAQMASSMQGELVALRQQVMAPREDGGAAGLAARITEVKEIMGLLEGLRPKVPEFNGAAADLQTTLAIHRANEEHEHRMAQLRLETRRIDQEMAIREAELANDRARMAQMGSALKEVAPLISQAISQQVFQGGGAPATGGALPAPPATNGNGEPPAWSTSCPACQGLIEIPEGTTTADCPHCRTRLGFEGHNAAVIGPPHGTTPAPMMGTMPVDLAELQPPPGLAPPPPTS